jgi:hypothetical protein
VSWSPGRFDAADAEMLFARVVPGAKFVARQPLRVAGHEGERLTIELPTTKRRSFLTLWYCDRDARTLQVGSFLSLPEPELGALHDRIVQTAQCHTLPPEARPKPVFPIVETPLGYRRVENALGLYLRGPGGEKVEFTPGAPGRMLVEHVERPGVVAAFMDASRAVKDLQVEARADTRAHPDGPRRLRRATATLPSGGRRRIVLTAWYCQRSNTSYIGGHEASAELPVERMEEALLRERCP